jgi:GAF domain-containing protein
MMWGRTPRRRSRWVDERDALQPDDLTMASLVAYMAAAAWRNAVLYAEQIKHAITDPLTGLLNTRWRRLAAPMDNPS